MFISPLRRRTSQVANIDTSVQLRSCSTRCKRSARSIQANVKHSISVASGRSAVRHSPTILVPFELFHPFSNLSSPLGYTPVRPAPTLSDRLVINVDPTGKIRIHLLDIENFLPFDFSYPLVRSVLSIPGMADVNRRNVERNRSSFSPNLFRLFCIRGFSWTV